MKRTGTTTSLAGGALVLLGALVAGAQPAGPPPDDQAAVPEAALTPAQMVTSVEAALPRMERAAANTRRELRDARIAKDVLRTICLTDCLNQMEVAVQTAKDRLETLRPAAERGDVERATQDHSVARVMIERVEELVAEANQCVGKETATVGDSESRVDVDPDIPEVVPSINPEDPIISDPPVVSSPIR